MTNVDSRPALYKLANNFLLFIVTCGFIGYLPGAPGTYASILGCIAVYFLASDSVLVNVVFVCSLIVCSVVCINLLKYNGEDPSYIVIDEFAGVFVTMAGFKPDLLNITCGFILFRFFDIIKPYPIRNVEHFKRGYGIVADDVLAGIFANMLMNLGYIIFKA